MKVHLDIHLLLGNKYAAQISFLFLLKLKTRYFEKDENNFTYSIANNENKTWKERMYMGFILMPERKKLCNNLNMTWMQNQRMQLEKARHCFKPNKSALDTRRIKQDWNQKTNHCFTSLWPDGSEPNTYSCCCLYKTLTITLWRSVSEFPFEAHVCPFSVNLPILISALRCREQEWEKFLLDVVFRNVRCALVSIEINLFMEMESVLAM